jgi:hypothetical protein
VITDSCYVLVLRYYLTKSTLRHGRLTSIFLHCTSVFSLETPLEIGLLVHRMRSRTAGCTGYSFLTRACDIPFRPGSKLTCTHFGDLPSCHIPVRCLTKSAANQWLGHTAPVVTRRNHCEIFQRFYTWIVGSITCIAPPFCSYAL